MAIADRIAVMNAGELVQLGPPLDLYSSPRNLWVAQFIGSHPINVIDATLAPDGARLLGDGSWVSALPDAARAVVQQSATDGRFQVGLRPEHLTLSPPAASGQQAEVYTRQILGTDVLYELTTSGHLVRAVTPASQLFAIGDQVTIGFDWTEAFLFDPQTGTALT